MHTCIPLHGLNRSRHSCPRRVNAGNKNTPNMHYPRRWNVTTSMVGLKLFKRWSHICKHLTQNGESQISSWGMQKKKKRYLDYIACNSWLSSGIRIELNRSQFLTWESSSLYTTVSLGFAIFGEIFAYVTIFFNPTIEVITFCLCGGCVLGVFLLPAFTCLGHECQDLLNLWDGVHVCTD